MQKCNRSNGFHWAYLENMTNSPQYDVVTDAIPSLPRHDITSQAFRQIIWSSGSFTISVSKIIEFDRNETSQNLILALRMLQDDEGFSFRQSRLVNTDADSRAR